MLLITYMYYYKDYVCILGSGHVKIKANFVGTKLSKPGGIVTLEQIGKNK